MDHWKIFKQNAQRELDSKTVFHSFVQQRQYRISGIQDDRILIDRLSGGQTAGFKKYEVLNAIETLMNQKRIKKSELIHSVVREVMLVHLHPFVDWDKKSNELIWKPALDRVIVNKVEEAISDAPDDQLEKIQSLIYRRRHQNKFRKALMKIYHNKCAISGCTIDEVLEAAHITKYSGTGINSNDNGIILRSDLHILFDSQLLAIHPKDYTVHLHSKLKKSEYWKFNGIKVSDRSDISHINTKYLEEKWIEIDWA